MQGQRRDVVVDKAAGIALLILIDLHVRAVIAVQPVSGTEPHITLGILAYLYDGQLGQPVFQADRRKDQVIAVVSSEGGDSHGKGDGQRRCFEYIH